MGHKPRGISIYGAADLLSREAEQRGNFVNRVRAVQDNPPLILQSPVETGFRREDAVQPGQDPHASTLLTWGTPLVPSTKPAQELTAAIAEGNSCT